MKGGNDYDEAVAPRSEATGSQIDPSEAWGNLNGDTREARSPVSTA